MVKGLSSLKTVHSMPKLAANFKVENITTKHLISKGEYSPVLEKKDTDALETRSFDKR